MTLSHCRLPRRSAALLIFLCALAIRLCQVLVLDTSPNFSGGDTNWYMSTGYDLVTTGTTVGPIQTPPLYPLALGIVQVLVPGKPSAGHFYTFTEMQTMRVIQSVLGALLCLFVYQITRGYCSEQVGRLAGMVLAISPALVIEAGNLASEQLFMFLMFGGLALYASVQDDARPRDLVGAGILFGLATLTRAVFLLFPLIIAAHFFWMHRTRWNRPVLALLVSYGLVVSTWTVYNWLEWHRLIIGGEGLFSFLYQGAEGSNSPQGIDQQLEVPPENSTQVRQEKLREGFSRSITSDPLGWGQHRVKELVSAYLQPHQTVYFGGKSIKSAAADWIKQDRSVRGLIDLTRIKAFWPKLVLYLFHFTGLILGTAGMIRFRRQWRILWPVYGVVLYFTAVHLVLLALPRYLFPVYPVLWMFASAVIVQWWARRRSTAGQAAGSFSPIG